MSANKALLKKLEDTLLRELSNATGNILDNQELIATLESAKEKAVDISHKLTAAKATAKDIEEARVRYTPVATRGAVLLFVLVSLSAVNSMYEYSLAAFLKVFKQVGSVLSWVLSQKSWCACQGIGQGLHSGGGWWLVVPECVTMPMRISCALHVWHPGRLQCLDSSFVLCMPSPTQSLANSKWDATLEGRLSSIMDTLTTDVYSYTCLGLFERHKLMLSFQMAVKILEVGPNPLDVQVGT